MKKVLLFLCLILICISATSQDTKYRRSSLYSILISHPDLEFGKDIDTVFRRIPIPEKFDDHNLKIRTIKFGILKKNDNTEEENVRAFIETFNSKNELAKRLVSKWFNRKSKRGEDGTFDTNLIIERGLYDADYFDAQIANLSIRGQSLLADAGEELIGNTYVLFSDIKYVDKEETAGVIGAAIAIGGGVVSSFTGGLTSIAISAATDLAVDVADKISGFKVSITSYLYRLEWNEEIANTFYNQYYISSPDIEKKKAYENERNLFKLKFIGSHKIVTNKTTMAGVVNKHDMIRKVCERAIDKNIAQLQRKYEEFRVKTPLFSVEPLAAKIGHKEDIDENTRFEVLERIEDQSGKIQYKRVGVIKPKKNMIWDNRFMAEFEESTNTTQDFTEFEIISGGNFNPGMLIREL